MFYEALKNTFLQFLVAIPAAIVIVLLIVAILMIFGWVGVSLANLDSCVQSKLGVTQQDASRNVKRPRNKK